jgi:hypothetical protein
MTEFGGIINQTEAIRVLQDNAERFGWIYFLQGMSKGSLGLYVWGMGQGG